MSRLKPLLPCFLAVLLLAVLASTAAAHELEELYVLEDSRGDPFSTVHVGTGCEELGVGEQFAEEDEEILMMASGTLAFSCAAYDDPDIINFVVSITNMENVTYENLIYVADCCTRISNYDGWIGNVEWDDDSHAFLIDGQGMNRPLIYESLVEDERFQPGEVWQFILQDWRNLNYDEPNFQSFGVACDTGDPSTGSIITCVGCVPELLTIVLLFIGMVSLGGVCYYRQKRNYPHVVS